ncbi:dihydrofolate reductase family protein [Kiloniella antarctica]|uniref:Dihydrofolate reductase family protein n=1 Tax=Kiloniella antarctica TaxID=1550907 RepID=A0ABW5BM33_9PROT
MKSTSKNHASTPSRKLAILAFVTLDGVMQAPSSPQEDTTGGFMRGGWANDYWAEVMEQAQREAMSEPYDMLFGRKTYEMFAPHWSTASTDDPLATMMNNAQKYVVSTQDLDLTWQNSGLIYGDVCSKIKTLKQQPGNLIQVHGSCNLIQTLLKHDLIDEFRLWTFPVILGQGKRLFGEGVIPQNLTLTKSDTTKNGVTMGIYRRQ